MRMVPGSSLAWYFTRETRLTSDSQRSTSLCLSNDGIKKCAPPHLATSSLSFFVSLLSWLTLCCCFVRFGAQLSSGL